MIRLDDMDKAVLRLAQGDLPVGERPYDDWAHQLDIPVSELIERLEDLRGRGAIRDIKAVLRHTKAGIASGAMVAWAVDNDMVEQAGVEIARNRAVSHCYERPGFGRYSIFSMIHGSNREEVCLIISELSNTTGLMDYKVFWSIRELKKTSMRFFEEE